MLVITNWAMVNNEIDFLKKDDPLQKWLLVTIGAGIFALALWMTIEAVIAFFTLRQPTQPQEEPDE